MIVESEVGRQIREVLATSLRRSPSSIKPEQSLRDDLGLDSLTTFELLYDLEKTFDLEIPNDDLPGLQTLEDVVKYVEVHVKTSKVKPKSPKKTLTKKPLKNSSKPSTSKFKSAKAKTTLSSQKSRKNASPAKAPTAGPTTKHVTRTASSRKPSVSLKPKTKKK